MTKRSRIFEISGRLEMGLKLSRLSGSRPSFFRRGVVGASLSGDGTKPVVWQVYMMFMMRGMEGWRKGV